jgi:hypothetical protein
MLELVETIIMNPFIRIHMYKGSFGTLIKKIEIHGKIIHIPYHEFVPNRWIINEKRYWDDDSESYRITGPITCNRCRNNGFFKGAFFGYCNVCAEKHEYERGNGLFHSKTDKGLPYEADHCIQSIGWWGGTHVCPLPKEKSMWNTYLKGIDMTLIGDEMLINKYKNGYYSDIKEEKIKGYYVDLDLYYEEKKIEKDFYQQREEY